MKKRTQSKKVSQSDSVKNLIILHGWGSSPEVWEKTRAELEKIALKNNLHVNIHIPDLPGFGQSSKIKKPLTMDDYSNWLERYIADRKLTNIFLAGHSHGGRTILKYISKTSNPEIQKLILIAPAGIPDTRTSQKIKRAIFKKAAKIGKSLIKSLEETERYSKLKKLLYKLARESDYEKASPMMKETMKNVLSYNACIDIPKIHTPTTLIWGTKDTTTPYWMAGVFKTHLKDAQLISINANHYIPRTHPQKLAQLIVTELTS